MSSKQFQNNMQFYAHTGTCTIINRKINQNKITAKITVKAVPPTEIK